MAAATDSVDAVLPADVAVPRSDVVEIDRGSPKVDTHSGADLCPVVVVPHSGVARVGLSVVPVQVVVLRAARRGVMRDRIVVRIRDAARMDVQVVNPAVPVQVVVLRTARRGVMRG
ncbi:MAG: hypothetical protein VB858_09450, partial [Planctomycetaceae bacterium]